MSFEIRPFDAAAAADRELSEYHLAKAASWQLDFPEDPPVSYEAAVGRLRTPWLSDGTCRYWAAYANGTLVGLGKLAVQEGENSAIADAEVTVHPDVRRQGIGTALLRALLPALHESGRSTVNSAAVKTGSPGALWAERFGFRVVNRSVVQTLVIDETKPELWDVPVPAGYRLARWISPAPEELIDAYAAARDAVQDAPLGESSVRHPRWDRERIRTEERTLAEQGAQERVVVVIHEATGDIVGVTGLLGYAYRPENCYQNDTSVVSAHRGNGLGRTVKAAMMRWLVAERPEVRRILTGTNADNVHMIAVNEALGYRILRRLDWRETTTAELTDALA
ncbi:GNAT family N-acetyltransferase [Kitasatospora sp. LaBMicrA B282]|uniref:GNAT family N-acetyltransferase n=1 Tax=Kitasatospora sp. LaBMicrA B282 TaxID=3420949 RepID=UPI003D13E850